MMARSNADGWVQRFGGERGLGFILPLLFATMLATLAIYQNQRFVQLELAGETGIATIQSKWSGPSYECSRNGSTQYRMQVSFTVGEIMRRGEVSVSHRFYYAHNEGEQVAIRYLPDTPQIREIDPSRHAKFVKEWLLIIGLLVAISIYNLLFLEPATKAKKEENYDDIWR